MLLAVPARGQRWRVQQPHPRITGGNLSHDLRSAVVGRIVQHQHLQLHPGTRQHALHARSDVPFFIPRRNQHRNPHSVCATNRRAIPPQVHDEQYRRNRRAA
jgi:hypothetical protein